MTPILQSHLPFAPWMEARTARLPGTQPVDGEDWLRVDDAFAPQMAERDRLLGSSAPVVHALLPQAVPAAAELLDMVLDRLTRMPGYKVTPAIVVRPDGVPVGVDRATPLMTLGRLVQEDLCLLQSGAGGAHLLTGAVLCFPASWTLTQKIGKPLTGIHGPVPEYDANVALRVQRLFDALRVGQPLWRANALIYDDPTLHQPRMEGVDRPRPVQRLYVRSERQCLIRLPQSGAVAFVIHTYLVRLADLTAPERQTLIDLKGGKGPPSL